MITAQLDQEEHANRNDRMLSNWRQSISQQHRSPVEWNSGGASADHMDPGCDGDEVVGTYSSYGHQNHHMQHRKQQQTQLLNGSGENGQLSLKIIRQPEHHYRPRYQKEGSRGCVKDSTGRFPLSVQV